MNRTRTTRAIVLHTSRIGEIHKGVVLLTPDEGLVRAIAHGAYSPRGRLRGSTNLFCCGTACLYTDPVKNSTKITDMDAERSFPGIREDLERFYTASLWAEAVLKTYATGGRSEEVFSLLLGALSLLDDAPGGRAHLISIQFTWRFLGLSGAQPDLGICARSGEVLAEDEPAFYSSEDQGFCTSLQSRDGMPVWQPPALRYMRSAEALDLAAAAGITPAAGVAVLVKRLLYRILQEHVESPLNCLRSGSGIL